MFKKITLFLVAITTVNPIFLIGLSFKDVLQHNSDITYLKCHDSISFNYPELPVAQYPQYHPYQGQFAETFVLKIPNGKVCSKFGFVQINNTIITELLPQNYPITTHQKLFTDCNISAQRCAKIPGKVLVLSRIDEYCYGHWLGEFLPRLALITQHNIDYDWIYVCYDKPYIKETLSLLGIDASKVIQPFNEHFYIQADELIVPSLTVRRVPVAGQVFQPAHPSTMYCPEWCINWLRNTFIPKAHEQFSQQNFCPKVFISRKDAYQRRMTNEDEIFARFEQHGFTRYTLGNMSFLEQVMLFNQATHIVALHGSGLTNLLFCQPGTNVAEIYQNQFDSTFWQLSQTVGLNHTCIKTQDPQPGSWKVDTHVPLSIIDDYIKNNL